jgi:rod shape-determining protein MreC
MKRDITVLICFFVLIGALFSLPQNQTNELANSIRDVFAAPQTGLRQLREWFKAVTSDKQRLWRENQNLRFQAEELRHELRSYKSLREENQELRVLLKLKTLSNYPLLPAQLVMHDVNGWWQMIRIDKGSGDGVEINLPVTSPEGLLGQIVSVSARTADVLFLTNPKMKIAARLARSDVFGIVRGEGASLGEDARCRMDFIMKNAEVNRADEIVTSGLGGVYPAGLVIGYVEEVKLDTSGLFQYAEVIPAADYKSLDIVFVVLPEKHAGMAAPGEMRRK